MRPDALFPLFADAGTLPGIGPKIAQSLEKIGITRVVDLLWHAPSGLIDRTIMPSVQGAVDGSIASFEVTIDKHEASTHPRKPYVITCHDSSGVLSLVFFNGRGDYLQRTYPVGAEMIISGTVARYQGSLQMTHPDVAVPAAQKADVLNVHPVYPTTGGMAQKTLHKSLAAAIERIPDLKEWTDPHLVDREKWFSWSAALKALHAPQKPHDIAPESPIRRRLAYDELLANQVALTIMRLHQKARPGRRMMPDLARRDALLGQLPFSLTPAQITTVQDIDADMGRDHAMMRLLQGDVGSGKTIVALIAMLTAQGAGAQSALLAPTEILARQHLESLKPLADQLGLTIELLTGRDKGKVRTAKLMALMDGTIHILIGTHAIIQDDIVYKDLGLVVIDEQHRFGVHQRLALSSKGKAPDVLVMTATPIPRTLTMTAYGDMDVSRLTGKPPGRKPVDTRVMPSSKISALEDGLARTIADEGQAFWVCARVSDDDDSPLTSVEERYAHLKARFGDVVGFVHGQMPAAEKDSVMEGFVSGRIKILVATTVIEVGVNVPNATVMIIENATQFGLAQLHQLRGRVGRGLANATCILLYSPPLGDIARQRLETLRQSDDGFYISERDLDLRGAGEVLGTRQSGLPAFKLADLAADTDLMAMARDDAILLLDRDPSLSTPRGQAVRTLLYLFERDKAVQFLRSG